MILFHFVLVFALLYEIDCRSNCQRKFKDVRLAPNYFDYKTTGNLKVAYENKAEAKCGNKITLLSVISGKPPVVKFNGKKNCELMSIIMFDPDFPLQGPYLHWFIANIPANVMKTGYSGQAGKEIASYNIPGTTTGNHRYTTCVYCQNKYIKTCKKYNAISKIGVNIRSLAKQYNLQNPEACNFFYLTNVNVKLLDDQPVFKAVDPIKKDLGNTDKTGRII